MTNAKRPVVNQQMLIRKPAADVYNALIDPAQTTHFWFTRGSGPLQPGAVVTWEWEMYGVSAQVRVRDLQPNRRILIEWQDPPHPVEFTLDERPDGTTLVKITVQGFDGSDDEAVAAALDSMGGFTFLLSAMKAWLEHGVELNVVADHFPDHHVA
ncbi:MAG: polyketide cyclase [Gammaproteobacteria bacterium]|nr:polyketide cyclase [Gammaproteobacteria bacterium]